MMGIGDFRCCVLLILGGLFWAAFISPNPVWLCTSVVVLTISFGVEVIWKKISDNGKEGA